MKIRTLLLGSVALGGLTTAGYAADLGVVTSLDVCDELGLSGLTISSDENCLQISGEVDFSYTAGDYKDGDSAVDYNTTSDGQDFLVFERNAIGVAPGYQSVNTVDNNDGTIDREVDIDAWLKFVATSSTDFGPASATIKLISKNFTGTASPAVSVDEAWVGIGDTTVISAGYKSSIFYTKDDEPLNYLGLFNSSDVDAGVGFRANFSAKNNFSQDINGDGTPETPPLVADTDYTDAGEVWGTVDTGGAVIQISHNLGNGVVISGALEDLGNSHGGGLTGVGVVKYTGDGVSAHASWAANTVGIWNLHAGFKGTWDPVTVVGALAAANGYWNVLGSASVTLDMFTLAASAEATSSGEVGAGGSLSAAVSEGVKINLGGKYFSGPTNTGYQAELGLVADVTETIKASAAIGLADSSRSPGFAYGKAGLDWAPGGGFKAGVSGQVNSLGGYKAVFTASKTIK